MVGAYDIFQSIERKWPEWQIRLVGDSYPAIDGGPQEACQEIGWKRRLPMYQTGGIQPLLFVCCPSMNSKNTSGFHVFIHKTPSCWPWPLDFPYKSNCEFGVGHTFYIFSPMRCELISAYIYICMYVYIYMYKSLRIYIYTGIIYIYICIHIHRSYTYIAIYIHSFIQFYTVIYSYIQLYIVIYI